MRRLLGETALPPTAAIAPEVTARFFEMPLREAREAFERIYFEQLLGKEQSNMSRVANARASSARIFTASSSNSTSASRGASDEGMLTPDATRTQVAPAPWPAPRWRDRCRLRRHRHQPVVHVARVLHGPHGLPLTPANVLGMLSMIFWALTIIVTLKYVTLIMRADNRGEGGILALTALVSRGLAISAARAGGWSASAFSARRCSTATA